MSFLITLSHFRTENWSNRPFCSGLINDTYGHLVGDNILKEVIKIIMHNIFSRDVLFRYGGDEFSLILTKTSSSGIIQAAEKIRKEIDEHKFDFGVDQASQHVTISMGLVIFDEVLNKESEAILEIADNRLLIAKSLGRNRVVYRDNPCTHHSFVKCMPIIFKNKPIGILFWFNKRENSIFTLAKNTARTR